MLPARALFYALVVSLITAVMSGLLIHLASLQSLQQADQFNREQVLRNVASGIALLKGDNANVLRQYHSLYGEDNQVIELEKYDWGLFKAGWVKAVLPGWNGATDTITRSVLLGAKYQPFLESALWLSDQNKPLSVTGQTVIKGSVYVPKGNVERGFIAGSPYQGTKLVYGKQYKSRKMLVKPDLSKLERLLTNWEEGGVPYGESNQLQRQPFEKGVLQLSGGRVVLDNCHLSGRIIIRASQSITVRPGSVLENVILIAPVIRFESGCEVQLQAFATKVLEVAEDCVFSYPSVLGLVRTDKEEEQPLLKVGEGTELTGLVFAYDKAYFRKPVLLEIKKEALIRGQVFCNGKLDHRGTVLGNVIAKSFFLNTGSATYDQLLLDAVIDRPALSEHYLGPFFMKGTDQLNVIQWLD